MNNTLKNWNKQARIWHISKLLLQRSQSRSRAWKSHNKVRSAAYSENCLTSSQSFVSGSFPRALCSCKQHGEVEGQKERERRRRRRRIKDGGTYLRLRRTCEKSLCNCQTACWAKTHETVVQNREKRLASNAVWAAVILSNISRSESWSLFFLRSTDDHDPYLQC